MYGEFRDAGRDIPDLPCGGFPDMILYFRLS